MHGRFLFPLAAALALLACGTQPESASPERPVTPPEPLVWSAPAAAPPRPKVSQKDAAALLKHADDCLRDPTCTEDGAALYRAADDDGAKDVYCYRFYYGAGVVRDLPRARACFEREVAAQPRGCNGSPDLERAYLASMLIDGQGGPVDFKRAGELLEECYRDGTVSGLEHEIEERRMPQAWQKLPLDFCVDIGGTTFTMGRCRMMEVDRILLERAQVERVLLARLDKDAAKLEIKARDAWSSFAVAEADAYGDGYRGGSMRILVEAAHHGILERRRVEALRKFLDYKPNAGIAAAEAERNLEQAFAASCRTDAPRRKLCAAARKAFVAYREAEVALHVRVHGASHGERQVASDVRAATMQQYANDLEDFDKP
jgi:uncharacterized protein YecT (DUF1311 family)